MTLAESAPVRLYDTLRARLDGFPYSGLALIARAATFTVFFRSGLVKIADWNGTLTLFRDEYHLPVLPPELAARMAVCMELGVSSLVLLGLFTRLGVTALLGMILVIQTLVYPMAWPDHIQWVGFMSVLLFRGPGKISADWALGKALKPSPPHG